MILNIPLPWLQLVKQKVRFFVALAGIAFISVLMFMQIGFQDALYSSATQVHKHLQGDLFLLSSQYKSLTSTQSFPRSRLYQTLGFNGIESVQPLYVQFAKLKNPVNGRKYPIYVLGFEPIKSIFKLPEVEQNFQLLRELNELNTLSLPILIGVSRKSMIYKTLDVDPMLALNGTTALHMFALMQGAHLLRVHDVRAAWETIRLFNQLQS